MATQWESVNIRSGTERIGKKWNQRYVTYLKWFCFEMYWLKHSFFEFRKLKQFYNVHYQTCYDDMQISGLSICNIPQMLPWEYFYWKIAIWRGRVWLISRNSYSSQYWSPLCYPECYPGSLLTFRRNILRCPETSEHSRWYRAVVQVVVLWLFLGFTRLFARLIKCVSTFKIIWKSRINVSVWKS